MRTGIKVLDAMTNRPVMADIDSTIKEVAQLLTKYNVGSALIQENNEVVGIVTEKDFVTKVVARGLNSDDILVREVMEKDLITIEPEKDLFQAIELMKDNDIRKLPVEDDGKIVGFITMKDILKIEPELFDLLVEKLNIREESDKPIPKNADRFEDGICESCGNFSYRLVDDSGVRLCPECRP